VEGIAYHEGAPGHHFQIALAQETLGLPKFRRFGFYGAYIEGWGLYAERLGKEMGFYQDPYSDFGRLSLELWRAARLVTDTGSTASAGPARKAIDYFKQNTLLSERDIVKEVERYLTTPGQATSYKVGQLEILELREKARRCSATATTCATSTRSCSATAPFPWTCWKPRSTPTLRKVGRGPVRRRGSRRVLDELSLPTSHFATTRAVERGPRRGPRASRGAVGAGARGPGAPFGCAELRPG
jgi:hypothetical protein